MSYKHFAGKRVEWEFATDHRRGMCLTGLGTVDEVEGKNIMIGGDWKWGPDLKNLRFLSMETRIKEVKRQIIDNESVAKKTDGGIGLPVGSGNVEYRIRSLAVKELLNVFLDKNDLDLAVSKAKIHARELVARHNARRPKDMNWQRWEGTADHDISRAQRMLSS